MASNSKRSKDPTEVALSAIQDALNLRDLDVPSTGSAAVAKGAPVLGSPVLGRRSWVPVLGSPVLGSPVLGSPVEPTGPSVRPDRFWDTRPDVSDRDDHGAVQAANDDREAVGEILRSLQRQPARTPFLLAGVFAVLWTLTVGALAFVFGDQLRLLADDTNWVVAGITLLGAFGAPILLIFTLAAMMARLNEMRTITNAMAKAALRLDEPGSSAHNSIVTVGRAVRREVAAMGDGIERALARAAELQALVNSEVAALERAYSDNEVRIRTMVDGLARQREGMVGEAEQVRTVLAGVHVDLSNGIDTLSEVLTERVNHAWQLITRSLGEKGSQITHSLETAGDALIEQLGARGAELLEKFERTSDETSRAVGLASDRIASSLSVKSDFLNDEISRFTAELEQSMVSRLDDVVDSFSRKSSAVLDTVENRTREFTSAFSERSDTVSRTLIDITGRLSDTISLRADEVNNTLKTTGKSIVRDLGLHSGDVVSKLEEAGQKITETILSRSSDAAENFANHAETFGVHDQVPQRRCPHHAGGAAAHLRGDIQARGPSSGRAHCPAMRCR